MSYLILAVTIAMLTSVFSYTSYKQSQRIKELEAIKMYYEKVLEHQRNPSTIEEFTKWFFNEKEKD